MIHLPASVRVYLCLAPCDMRKSFDSLQTLVREHLELTLLPDTCLSLRAGGKHRVKILYFDRDGFARGASGWRRGRTLFRLATAAQNAGVRSPHRN
jgi:transposase